jgi:hypothetical protein
MATEKTLAAKITLDGSEADQSIKSIKTQLKEANAELIKVSERFGDTSAEAVKAAKAVAGLKDRIGDAKALSDAFNPDKKFQAVSQAIAGVAGGFAALQGGMALFGVESKDTEKALLKVQSAMALSQGISSVTESIDAFKNLGTVLKSFSIVQKVITAAQWLWNTAMAANPIGAIVAVVVALIAGIVALTSWMIKNSDAAADNAKHIKDSTKALEDQKKATDNSSEALKKNNEYTLAMMKAQGKNNDEIRKAETLLAAKETALARTSFAIANNTYEIERNRLATMKANGADEDQIKAQEELTKKYGENLTDKAKKLKDAKTAEIDIERKHNIQIEQEKTDDNKKKEEKQKSADEKSKANKQKSKEDEKNALVEANKLLADLEKNLLDKRKQKEYDIEQTFQERKKLLIKAGIKDFTAIEKDRQKSLEDLDKEDAAKRIKAINDTDKITQDARLASMKEGYTKVQFELEIEKQGQIDAALDLLNTKQITKEEYLKREEEIDKLYNAKSIKIQEDHAKEVFNADVTKLDTQVANEELAFQVRQSALDKEQELIDNAYAKGLMSDKAYTDASAKNSKTRAAIDKAEKAAKMQYIRDIGSILSGLADVLGRNTKAGKKAAIAGLLIDQGMNVAKITMDTIAATKAITKKYAGVPGGQIPAAVETAINIAQGVISVAKSIQAVKKGISDINSAGGGGGEGGGSGSGGGDIGSAPMGSAPLSPEASVTALPQDQINQLSTANAAVRNYVLESDVTSNQERITRINRAARIN